MWNGKRRVESRRELDRERERAHGFQRRTRARHRKTKKGVKGKEKEAAQGIEEQGCGRGGE